MYKIIVLGQDFCPFCVKAKDLLKKIRKKKLVSSASYYSLDKYYKSPSSRAKIRKANKLAGNYGFIPIVIINDTFVGGYDKLLKFYKYL